MAQAASAADATQKLFLELKSRNEDSRVRAASELYDHVLAVSRGIICS
jgi:FKBP12-rapamycin complex-associated protein